MSQIGCLGYNLKYFNYSSLLIQCSYVTILVSIKVTILIKVVGFQKPPSKNNFDVISLK